MDVELKLSPAQARVLYDLIGHVEGSGAVVDELREIEGHLESNISPSLRGLFDGHLQARTIQAITDDLFE